MQFTAKLRNMGQIKVYLTKLTPFMLWTRHKRGGEMPEIVPLSLCLWDYDK